MVARGISKDKILDVLESAEWASDEGREAFYRDMVNGGGGMRKLGADGKLYHIPDVYRKD